MPAATPTTLADLADAWKVHHRSWTGDACILTVSLAEGPQTVTFGAKELPLDGIGLQALLSFYGIPLAFFDRLTGEERHYLLNSRIDHTPGEITLTYTSHHLIDALKPSQPRLDPFQFAMAATTALPSDSKILESWNTPTDLRIDVIAPDGDPDGTQRGIRIGQNRKQNLAPWATPILYHAPSGAVVHITDPSLKIDARGADSDTLFNLLSSDVLRAWARTPHDLEALADLNHESVAQQRITLLHRIGAEHKIPGRYLPRMDAHLANLVDPTLQDVALTIAATAAAPDIPQAGLRLRLQAAAGRIVTDHAQRCSSCHALIAA